MVETSNFLIWGLATDSSRSGLWQKLQTVSGNDLHHIVLGRRCFFFFSKASYLDWAENKSFVVLKVGLIRSNNKIVSAVSLLNEDLITVDNKHLSKLTGNGLIVILDKQDYRLTAYKTLLAVPEMFYTCEDEYILCSNNLRLLSRLIDTPRLNQFAIPLHFLYRSVPGHQTYFENVCRLQPGKVLSWQHTHITTNLLCDLRSIQSSDDYLPLTPASVTQFYEQLGQVLQSYLTAIEENGKGFALLLSGGIDSSLLQLALNTILPVTNERYSFSYVTKLPSFIPEKENAEVAADHFGTQHTFVSVPMRDYPNWLLDTIDILGQPPHHEQMCYALPFLEYIAEHRQDINTLFNGQAADALHGLPIAKEIYQIQKYAHWPVPVLRLIGSLLGPIWHNKAYGANRAAYLSPHLNNPESPLYPLNRQAMYSNWETLIKCFEKSTLMQAMTYRRELETQYLNSSVLPEKAQVVDLLSDAYDTACIRYQLGLYYGKATVFPYLDTDILKASFRYMPTERYFHFGETKPVLKQILRNHSAYSILNKPKYGGGFENDLLTWMKEGILRELVQEIERPGFMDKKVFESKINQPDWFTWNLLTFDLFKKRVLDQT